ncbi:beta-galactosidase trimerization domain-containing protein [Amycolatopsis sp. H20-H5]|uniref:beta-galactosidase trimerization domain-containing protein n=1 Tax=Amycolatopsis sp. H20-H5 TaxID=3046309 RepID=UPI002DBF03E8|nr:beta-galactosidase trimerization domain-containing protein [Amycolatopsis sp. H20-H5]MEC3976888.1 beta-galactosidase trimerization domain-containing protein [Amycolatopsis sp. H20-H5]
MTGFTVSGGRLLRDGQPFTAVGVDHHPSRAGCRIWSDWDAVALERDFADIAAARLNTVRLFVFWRDFEPAPGRYDEKAFARLHDAVTLAGAAGLACVVSVLTIWMNGQLLDLPWRAGRSLWRDEEMLVRQEEFVRAVGGCLSDVDNVLAYDLGDEIGNVDPVESATLSREQVAAWHARLAAALRGAHPGVAVCQAGDASGVLRGSPFGVDNAGELDLVAVHGFPTWAPGSIEATSSYKATNLTSFLVRFAAAYGVPFVDELGAYGVGEDVAAGYLRASAASAMANGAAGVLVWCWQDIASAQEPYADRPMERFAGLTRLDGTPKPALAEVRRVAESAADLAGSERRARIAVYIPEHARVAGKSYLDSGVGTLATFYAYLLLKRAHLDFDLVSGDLDGYGLVICPSVTHVTLTDLDRLRAHLARGGTVYYSLGDHLHGFPGADLAGAELSDYSLTPEGKTAIRWSEVDWPLDWKTGGATTIGLVATTGEPIARYPDGTPAVLVNRVGEGTVVFCGAPLERQLDQPGRLTGSRWERLYRRIARLAGIVPTVDCADPDVELVADGNRVVVVNHGARRAGCDLVWPGGERVAVRLAAKDWVIVEEEPV